ncbi:MAG TPA: ABC transporter permease [Syntrophomonadaceae bacterium]|nr:ABC transporter permease [Syntrophomonadaceae bacterium]
MKTDIWTIMSREVFYMWRDRGLRYILLLGPLLGILLFAGIYSSETIKHIPTAVVDLDDSQSSLDLIKNFENADNLSIISHPSSYKDLEEMIKEGRVVVGIVIPEDFGRNLNNLKGSRVLCIIDASNYIYATNASNAVLGVTRTISAQAGIKTLIARGMEPGQAQNTYQGIEFVEQPWYNPTLNYAYFLVLGLALNIWQYCCMLTASMLVIGETGVKSWLQVKASGFSLSRLFVGKSLTHILLLTILVLPIYFLVFVILKYPLACSFGQLFLLTFFFILAVHSIGTLVSSLVSNAVDATRIGMMVAVPSFMVTGYTWPLEAMPAWLGKAAWILPHTWFFQALNYLTFKGGGWSFVWPYLLVLLLMAVLFYGLTALVVRYKEGC